MKQYLDLAKAVKEKGTYKAPAREGMPGTTSLFGYQFRHDLSEGFPLLTTKKVSFKNIVTELLWFLRGDTNIKYLVDNGCNIWNEDAYNYYCKVSRSQGQNNLASFSRFIECVKEGKIEKWGLSNYTLGDCGKQYGALWRDWGGDGKKLGEFFVFDVNNIPAESLNNNFEGTLSHLRNIAVESGILPIDLSKYSASGVDQIKELIQGLKDNPFSRRHILTAWNPSTLDQMALNACHALAQFNCRPLSHGERVLIFESTEVRRVGPVDKERLDNAGVPEYKLDCQMYQRSADLFLGVPFNIGSYALLTHILSQICNMIPGDFIHTFGDVHIYDNHMDQINEQLNREPKELPQLDLSPWLINSIKEGHCLLNFDEWIQSVSYSDFGLEGYKPHPSIKGELSTGLKK